MITPQFGKIFADFGLAVPSLTTELIILSRFILDFGWYPEYVLCGGIACLWILFFWMCSSRWVARRSTSLPLIGPAFHFAALAEFCQILALLVETHVPFSRALRYSGDACSDDWLRRKCQKMAVDIERGSSPAEAARLAQLPTAISQVFGHAPSEESMIGGLRGLADLYSARCSVSFEVVNSLAESLIVASVIGCVGVIAVALFVPLIKLLNDLQ